MISIKKTVTTIMIYFNGDVKTSWPILNNWD